MVGKAIKYGTIAAGGIVVVSVVVFGMDGLSYLRSSARTVRLAVKDSVPIEFELKRARDLLDEIIPEMHANVRLIAAEEVEVAGLKSDIQQAEISLVSERTRVAKLREMMNVQRVSYAVGGMNYTREQVKDELSRQFDRFKEAEMVMAGKKRLLDTREKSLKAAVAVLERTRSQKTRLEDQIQSLEGQYRLVKAAAVGSAVNIDNSKLAQTERLIGEVKKRLDVAERVLAHEARFTQPMQLDTVSESDLVSQVDEHLSGNDQYKAPEPVAEKAPASQPSGPVALAPNVAE